MAILESGYLRVATVWGAPLRIHWSAPVLALVIGGLHFVPLSWLAFLLLIVAHELGHGVVARAYKQHILGIEVNALGGMCRYQGRTTPIGSAMIAWGGVWAQMAILVLSSIVVVAVPNLPPVIDETLINVFIRLNGLMMAINLIPFGTLDGARAWQLPRLLYLRFKLRGLERQSARLRNPASRNAGSVTPIGRATSKRKGGPPLRVVYGGLADDMGVKDKEHDPRKDKRTLN